MSPELSASTPFPLSNLETRLHTSQRQSQRANPATSSILRKIVSTYLVLTLQVFVDESVAFVVWMDFLDVQN